MPLPTLDCQAMQSSNRVAVIFHKHSQGGDILVWSRLRRALTESADSAPNPHGHNANNVHSSPR